MQEEVDDQAGIVLIHGFGSGVFAWRNIIDRLALRARCRVYAFDRPGFGRVSSFSQTFIFNTLASASGLEILLLTNTPA